jgi:Fe-S cluster assembly protein SufD
MKNPFEHKESTYLKELQGSAAPVTTHVDVLEKARAAAVENLAEWPFPSARFEDWRQISLKPLYRKQFEAAAAEPAVMRSDFEHLLFDESKTSTLVLVNGRVRKDLSSIDNLPEGCFVGSAGDAPENVAKAFDAHYGQVAKYEKDAFTAFNTACAADVALVHIPSDVKVEAPIHVINITDARNAQVFTTPRAFIFGGHHAEATVVEDFIGLGEHAYFNTSVTETALGDGAHITHIKVQRETRQAYHISRVASLLSRDSNYNSYAISKGAALYRNEPLSLVDAENAHATIDGLVMVNGNQVSDTHSTLDHMKANCTSHQLHKVIANGAGQSIFNGKIFVRQDSQKIDAFQENRNLLLSENANVFTKPQLEIFADDVKCSHGATIGQLSEEEVFYMQSRGISRSEAVRMLTYGYALEVIENLPVPSLREQLSYAVAEFTGAEIEEQDIV